MTFASHVKRPSDYLPTGTAYHSSLTCCGTWIPGPEAGQPASSFSTAQSEGDLQSAVRAIARSMSGATSPIYDFLAQEVLNNISDDLEVFLIRASLLDTVVSSHVIALFADRSEKLTHGATQAWIDDADRLGLLTRSSQSSESRQLHPLLKDFLGRALIHRHTPGEIQQMHLGVARTLSDSEPLAACHHFLEAGEQEEAMQMPREVGHADDGVGPMGDRV